MGGGQRSRIEPEPHSRTLEIITRGRDLRRFVVEGTNITAEGGGGNRKPIGEVGSCESRVAERIH